MKKSTAISAMLILCVGLMLPSRSVFAQDVPHVFDSTIPITPELRADLDAWLAVDPPSSAVLYAVTYAEPTAFGDTYASLAGFDITSPDQGWSLTGDENGVSHLLWVGTVLVHDDHSVELRTKTQAEEQQSSAVITRLAMPSFMGPGGGAYVNFPWTHGRSMMYGPLGVHGIGYSQSNMVAVDLVGGNNMGSGIAPPTVYTSASGMIDYVCADDDSTAIRTSNEDGDVFIYAHLVDNENLVMDHSFLSGQMIGTLTYGSFGAPNEGCGWADQAPENYHLHWGFKPQSGQYRAESCILTTSSGIWKCGDESIAPTDFLIASGGCSTTAHYTGTGDCSGYGAGGGETLGDPTFFDYLVVGVLNVFDAAIVQNLPEHEASPLVTPLMNGAMIVFRVVNVLIIGNLNFTPTITLWIYAITFKLLFSVIWLVGAVLRTIKALPTL